MKNVIENKRAKTFAVKTPNGKEKVYKTRAGAEAWAEKHNESHSIPEIVTANTYFWSPACNASGRRGNEKRRESEIENFCHIFARIPTIRVEGFYQETGGHVYKSMTYEVSKKGEWKTTNLTGLIGEAARWGITLVK